MGQSNAFSVALMLLVPLPSIVFYALFLDRCSEGLPAGDTEKGEGQFWASICDWGLRHPWLLVNVLFLLNVDVLFWIIGSFQQSFWLIDPYWTIIPVFIVHYFAAHPSVQTNKARSIAVTFLIWIWAIRLTYSYLRREEWRLGHQEDWRYAVYRKQYSKHWWWMSIFMVFLSQHVFLIGLTLPLYTVYSNSHPWGIWDGLAVFLCILGIFIAHVADTQLYYFVYKNKILKDIGAPKVPLMENGLWYYSRHPNYFGEQLFWWGLSLFAVNVGQGWAVIGTVMNSACLAYVTVLVEKKMLQDESRANVYRAYQKSTSVLIPWFKFNALGKVKEKPKIK